jgi:hypothetical protein
MPNPNFEPIIGSSFSDIGAQRERWAGFNANIEAQNMARAAAAEQAQNDYLARVAAMQREDATRQAAIDSRAQEMGLQFALGQQNRADVLRSEANRAAREQSNLSEQMKFAREDLASRERQAAEKPEAIKLQQDAAIEHRGQLFAVDYAGLMERKAAADAALETIQQEIDKNKADLDTIKQAKKPTPEQSTRLMEINTGAPELQKRFRAAFGAAEHLKNAYQTLMHQMSAGDYKPVDEEGKIVHEGSGKEWNFNTALNKAAKTPAAIGGTDWFNPDFTENKEWQFVPDATTTGTAPSTLVPPSPTAPKTTWRRDSTGRLVPTMR